MSERLAALLGDVLDGRGSIGDLEPELRQVIWIFKPELAPEPDIDVSDLLNGVSRGPYANLALIEEEGDDSDIQALFSLDEAAKPSLKAEDIFESLTQGPLAESVNETLPNNVTSLFKRFRGPAIGGLLAVACALIILLPTNFRYDRPTELTPSDNDEALDIPEGSSSSRSERTQTTQDGRTKNQSVADHEESSSGSSIGMVDGRTDLNVQERPSSKIRKRGKPKSRSKKKKSTGFPMDGPTLSTRKKERVIGGKQSLELESDSAPIEVAPARSTKRGMGNRGRSDYANESDRSFNAASADAPQVAESEELRAFAPKAAPATPSSNEPSLQELRRLSWQFSALRNPLREPLRNQVEQAKSAEDLSLLLGRGGTDDDLEIAFRISRLESRLGIKSLRQALSLSGGAHSLRRRAWAALGDLYMGSGNTTKARAAYLNALSVK